MVLGQPHRPQKYGQPSEVPTKGWNVCLKLITKNNSFGINPNESLKNKYLV